MLQQPRRSTAGGAAPAAVVACRAVVVSGETDSIAPPALGADLARCLSDRGAGAIHHVLPCGHDLTAADGILARDWLAGKLTTLV